MHLRPRPISRSPRHHGLWKRCLELKVSSHKRYGPVRRCKSRDLGAGCRASARPEMDAILAREAS